MIYKNGVISEKGMNIRWRKWFYSNAYMVTKTGAFDSLFNIFLWIVLIFLYKYSCKYLKSNYTVSVVYCFKKLLWLWKLQNKSKLFWVCCRGNQIYATHRTCLQFNFERYFIYLQYYSLKSVLNKRYADI